MTRWGVGLSNGETFFEDTGLFKRIAGEKSPWLRLVDYIQVKKLTMTSLWILAEDNRTFHLPSASDRPKFKKFAEADIPTGYRCFRQIGQDQKVGAELESFIVIEAIYPNMVLQVWVDENDTRKSWTLVKQANT